MRQTQPSHIPEVMETSWSVTARRPNHSVKPWGQTFFQTRSVQTSLVQRLSAWGESGVRVTLPVAQYGEPLYNVSVGAGGWGTEESTNIKAPNAPIKIYYTEEQNMKRIMGRSIMRRQRSFSIKFCDSNPIIILFLLLLPPSFSFAPFLANIGFFLIPILNIDPC